MREDGILYAEDERAVAVDYDMRRHIGRRAGWSKKMFIVVTVCCFEASYRRDMSVTINGYGELVSLLSVLYTHRYTFIIINVEYAMFCYIGFVRRRPRLVIGCQSLVARDG